MDMRIAPPGLEPAVANKLLDLLSTDDAFRALFVKDTKSALELAGYNHYDARLPNPSICFWPKPGEELASKDRIAAARQKLISTITNVQKQEVSFDAQHPIFSESSV